MATTIGSAYVQILPSAEGIKGKLEGVLGGPVGEAGKGAGEGWSSAFLGGLGTLGKGVGVAVGALGAGVTAAGGAFTAAVSGVAQYGDNIDKMSQKMGLSAEKYQEWDAIMKHSGTSMESMKAGMKTLANAAEGNSKAFAELGLSQEQVASMSQEQLFEATISALQGVEDTTKRTYLAGKLLGRGATELGPLLNMNAADTEKMRQEVHALGGVMSDEAVKASARFQDSLQNMQTSIGGAGRSLLAEFLPGLSGVMDGIADIFAGNDGAGKIEQGVDQLITAAETILPRSMELGGKIVDRLGGAILDNAPRLMETGGKLLLTVAQGLLEKLPALPAAGIALFQSLTHTLAEQAPTLIPAAVEALLKFIDGLLANSDKLFESAGELLAALAQGIANSLPVVVELAPELIRHLVMAILNLSARVLYTGAEILIAFADGLQQEADALDRVASEAMDRFLSGIAAWWGRIRESGADLLDLFIQGIRDRIKKLVDTVKGVAQTVKDYLGFSEPKEGPLSNFHTYAPDMMDLYAKGIRANAWKVAGALEDGLTGALGTDNEAQFAALYARQQGAAQAVDQIQSSSGGSRVVQVTAPMVLDRTVFGRLLFELVEEERRRIGVQIAKGAAV